MQKRASVLRKRIESQDPFRLYPSAFNPKDYRIPMETGVSRKIIFAFELVGLRPNVWNRAKTIHDFASAI